MAAKTKSKSSENTGIRKKKTPTKTPAFAVAIAQIRKLHPEVGLSNSSVYLLSSLANTLADKVIDTAGKLAHYEKKDTLKAKHMATALKLVMAGPLGEQAYDHAGAAVRKYMNTESQEATEEAVETA